MKKLILHIGMGKCGSTSIQSFFSNISHPNIKYLKYPGGIDANPIVADYLHSDDIPRHIQHIIKSNPLTTSDPSGSKVITRIFLGKSLLSKMTRGSKSLQSTKDNNELISRVPLKFVEYIKNELERSEANIGIISAEFIAWLLTDESSAKLLDDLISAIGDQFCITILCYFRQPASSRFLSVLQEDAKYSKEIKLYVPSHLYSENVTVYKRWESLCESRNINWMPVLFSRNHLYLNDVIKDFCHRVDIDSIISKTFSSVLNTSIDPLLLCSIRKVIDHKHDLLPWDRLSQLVSKLSSVGTRLCSEYGIELNHQWNFKEKLKEYIDIISSQENLLRFVNQVANNDPSPWDSKLNLDPNFIYTILPDSLTYQNGYLTGELESFLENIDSHSIDSLAEILQLELMRVFSYTDQI